MRMTRRLQLCRDHGMAAAARLAAACLAVALLPALAPRLSPTARADTAALSAQGVPLTERVFAGLDGREQRLAAWRGKIIIANFWASWCGPCQFEIPRLRRWQQRYAPQGLQVVGIGVDVDAKLSNVARSLEIDYPLLVLPPAEGRPLLASLGDSEMMIPFTVVIDREGRIAYTHKGLIGDDEFDIAIAPLLASAALPR
jgi:thiol-disulfide isomerase/thioredoxin